MIQVIHPYTLVQRVRVSGENPVMLAAYLKVVCARDPQHYEGGLPKFSGWQVRQVDQANPAKGLFLETHALHTIKEPWTPFPGYISAEAAADMAISWVDEEVRSARSGSQNMRYPYPDTDGSYKQGWRLHYNDEVTKHTKGVVAIVPEWQVYGK